VIKNYDEWTASFGLTHKGWNPGGIPMYRDLAVPPDRITFPGALLLLEIGAKGGMIRPCGNFGIRLFAMTACFGYLSSI